MEKFVVSARKYRPQTFDTVVGQEHITTTLKNAIRSDHLAHAFLFCGPRGVGKTTCARILAKTINCEHPKEGEACNACHSCLSFNEGSSMNIHELDAASNNSVEDIRSLVEQVRFAPQAGKYKVYIIDEVHMLSSSAFNAFLKTLEEPPCYAIFILATTEKHKILPTILSRCQIFDFKRITLQDITSHLNAIIKTEHIEAEETALQLIALKSEGCMRDALSILDKIVSFTNGAVTYENTIEHLNILDSDYYFRLISFMLEQDLSGALLLYNDIDKKGFEGDIVLNGFSEFIRNLLICTDQRVASLLEVAENFRDKYADTAKKTSPSYLVSSLNILNESEINYRSARNKKLHVELTLIKLCYLRQALEITSSNGFDKKKIVDKARSIPLRNIQTFTAKTLEPLLQSDNNSKSKTKEAKRIISEIEAPHVTETNFKKEVNNNAQEFDKSGKLGTLTSLRKQIQKEHIMDPTAEDQPLEIMNLERAWQNFINQLKETKNPASQSFELAELIIKDPVSFEARVSNNINQRFLEYERNKACVFLQKELGIKQLQISITLTDSPQLNNLKDVPLNSKEQFLKIIEEYPMVKELKDKLRLELDY